MPCENGEYEPYVTLSGTPTRRPLSWHGWKRRTWIQRLYGTISQPSTADRGVAAWISSLLVSPASRSAPPANDADSTMNDGYGPISLESSETWDPDSSSWRTCPDLFGTDSRASSTTLPRSGSMRNGVCYQRQPLVPHINENASGSWPTATATDGERRGVIAAGTQTSLVHAAQLWPTACARDAKGKPGQNGDYQSLTSAADAWPTPAASDQKRSTPSPSQAERDTPGLGSGAGQWSTNGPHCQETPKPGPNGSPRATLNPSFVEALMGLPAGWSEA